jgi:hypothetical protein
METELQLFQVGQRVNRVQEQEPKGAIILEVVHLSEYVYLILYDELDEAQQPITGWWTESGLTEV